MVRRRAIKLSIIREFVSFPGAIFAPIVLFLNYEIPCNFLSRFLTTANCMNYFDLHNHSDFSDGELTIKEIARRARKKGYALGIADHLSPYYHLRGDELVLTYIDRIRRVGAFAGCELDLGERIPCSLSVLQQLDYIIGGLHSLQDFRGMNYFFFGKVESMNHKEEFMRAILRALEKYVRETPIDILAHPTYVPSFLGMSPKQAWTPARRKRLIKAVLEHDVAVEISNRWQVPDELFLAEAFSAGCTFSMGSDGHHSRDVVNLDYPMQMAQKLGIGEERFSVPGVKPKRLDRELARISKEMAG
jgi:histidinol phosphatase-like PHP family hydrolase